MTKHQSLDQSCNAFPSIAFQWRQQPEPQHPTAALYPLAIWPTLKARLLRRKQQELQGLCFLTSSDAIILTGALLPWISGAHWFYQPAQAQQLYLPVHLQPQIPVDILQQAIQEQWGAGSYLLSHQYHYWCLNEAKQLYLEDLCHGLQHEST